ncbi:lipoyl synthase [Candidatus Acetothermia bacterium]|nr:lipoyl synthase [Candidatus Acetothermia bacterium]MCI2427504.1 lipoyl synthase [Candidatus Acetothermia bacterium]MCI2428006.1 lipoyl synthase [Candidatus Acetothermia bacterium]
MERERVKVHVPAKAHTGQKMRSILKDYRVRTVCQEAVCPNIAECWGAMRATFMLLGDLCTRSCRFCAVKSGKRGRKLDPNEPRKIAALVQDLGLSYVLLTSVDRDDLTDGGAAHFAATVREIKESLPNVRVEVLVPDFSGKEESLRVIAASAVDVIGHNVETVRRLTPLVRPRCADYDRSLSVLSRFHSLAPATLIKSSLILGLGEEQSEIVSTLHDLRDTGVDIVTLGQYLQPTAKQIPVTRYLSSAEFIELERIARAIGFRSVAAGPLVRSSYHACELVE